MSYGAREVARMLGLTVAQVRSWVRAGFLDPTRGPRGEMRFSFQDLVLLRTAKGLVTAQIPPRRVRRALARLRAQLPPERPLTGVHIAAEGGRIVVGDGGARWQPESGQVLFDFSLAELAGQVAPLPREEDEALGADDWYGFGCDLEESAPDRAMAAYRRALEIDPRHPDARVNLGRLRHQAGDAAGACLEYRRALADHPEHATAAFNLGVALEDLARHPEAAAAYRRALDADPACADAHWNLACVYERVGQRAAALRHFRAYRQLRGR